MVKKILMVLTLLVEATLLIAYYGQTPQPKLTPPAPQTAEQQRLQKEEYDRINKQKAAQKRSTGDGLFPQPPLPPPASGTARTTPKP